MRRELMRATSTGFDCETETSTHTVGGDSVITRTERRPPSNAIDAGQVFGRYSVHARLGVGGMGEVYAAHDLQLDREVALKLIKPGSRGSAEDTLYSAVERQRLIAEAQAMAKLSHPNVVQVYEAGQLQGQTYLTMELVDGPTLRDWKPGSLAELLEAYAGAARGLAAAHAVGLVHRDFKPSNVLIGQDGRVRVADFGLALRPVTEHGVTLNDGSESNSQGARSRSSSSIAGPGTLPYMAPEQAFYGTGGEAADQFSFCVALFEAVYGQRPFPARGAMELLFKLDLCEVEFPEQPRFKVPAWLQRLLLKGLARRPEQRFESMDALHAELTADRGRRWRWLGVGALASGLATALALLAFSPEPPELPELDGVWDAEQRVELREAFAQVDAPWAAGSEAAALARLDHWSARWLSTARDGMDDEATMSCLNGARAHAQVLVNTMIEEGPRVLEGAVAALDTLPAPERCAFPNPKPGVDQAELQPMLLALADAAAQRSLGHFELAHTGAHAVLGQARALKLSHLELAALRQRGLAQLGAGRQDEGFEDLLAARDLAVRSADLRAQAELGVELAWLGRKLDDESLRGDRLRLAQAQVDALFEASDDPAARQHAQQLRARVMLTAALDALGRRHDEDAASMLEQGLELLRELGPEAEESSLALEYHHALANSLRARGELDEAEAAFVRLLARGERARGAGHPQNARIWYDAAGLAHQRRDLELAHARMLRSRDIRRSALSIDHPDLALSELGLAKLELNAGHNALAREHAELALASLERPGIRSDVLPDTLRLLGRLAARDQREPEAEAYYRRARELLGDDPILRAEIEYDLGLLLAKREQYIQATELLGVALPVLDTYLGDEGCRQLVRGYERHGIALEQLDPTHPERARASYERAHTCTTSDETRARLEQTLARLATN